MIAAERRLEEELFLTSFLWEEGKHIEFFRRVLDEVCDDPPDLERFHRENYCRLFYEELPAAMDALRVDALPAAQARAVVTYAMIVEGVLAETGYYSYFEALEQNDLLPGLRAGVAKLKQDESRHSAYGMYVLARLIAAAPELWPDVEARMNKLLPLALGVVDESLSPYPRAAVRARFRRSSPRTQRSSSPSATRVSSERGRRHSRSWRPGPKRTRRGSHRGDPPTHPPPTQRGKDRAYAADVPAVCRFRADSAHR